MEWVGYRIKLMIDLREDIEEGCRFKFFYQSFHEPFPQRKLSELRRSNFSVFIDLFLEDCNYKTRKAPLLSSVPFRVPTCHISKAFHR